MKAHMIAQTCTPIRAKFQSSADVKMQPTATNTKDPPYGLPPPTQRVGKKMQSCSFINLDAKHAI
ncbi:hypothetical protein T4B_5736 [Trichinella pseudospiralis]|uniref:Uncharacterized protein n=1 Tax=Trichinella pseudospiralis TaxID=6337 RepID=A0A0V1KDF6_TRIPS|nr:hypothetical protein T4B_5736 [Trichinella pseudospiralis]KRZ44885.1 hypothetical protein T4C_9916 [Trichinella pseudospiralis]